MILGGYWDKWRISWPAHEAGWQWRSFFCGGKWKHGGKMTNIWCPLALHIIHFLNSLVTLHQFEQSATLIYLCKLFFLSPSVPGPSPSVHLPNSSWGPRGHRGDRRGIVRRWVWCPQEETPSQTHALWYSPERRGQLLVGWERKREGVGERKWSDWAGESCERRAHLTIANQVSD